MTISMAGAGGGACSAGYCQTGLGGGGGGATGIGVGLCRHCSCRSSMLGQAHGVAQSQQLL